MTSHKCFFAAVVLVLCLAPSLALAQTNTENFSQFEFNFNNPGARATGIGGAFISIADDATAVEANPAGLTALIRPEVSIEGKAVRFKRKVTNFSHTGVFNNYRIQSKEFENNIISPSFASVVWPFRRILTAALFRHELVNFKTSYYTKGSFVQPLTDGSYFFPVRADVNMKVVNWGAGVALRVARGVSVGASFGVSQASVNSVLSRYFIEVFDESNIANESSINATRTNFFVNAGVIVQPVENLSVGAIFKYRPSFSFEHKFRISGYPDDEIRTKDVNFNVPKAAGLGVSYRPLDVLTISLDGVYTFYSDLTKDFAVTFTEGAVQGKDFTVDDAIEVHAGVEYVLLTRFAGFVFRGGVYTEPDNRIRFSGVPADVPPLDDAARNRIFSRQTMAALFQAGESDVHYTFGVGFLLSDNFQLDVAGDLSNGTDQAVASLVVRF